LKLIQSYNKAIVLAALPGKAEVKFTPQGKSYEVVIAKGSETETGISDEMGVRGYPRYTSSIEK
jgi:hypothetical protein